MATGDIWKVDTVMQQQGVNAVNVFYWRQIGDTNNPNGDISSVATAWQDTLQVPWQNILSDRVSFLGLRIQRWLPKDQLPSIAPINNVTGNIDSDPLQSTKAAMVAVYTDRHDRSGRGRHFFMGIPESSVEVNQWVFIPKLAFNTFVSAIQGIIQGSGDTASYRMGVWSNTHQEFNQSVNMEARPTIYQQRSRQAEGL